VTISSKKTAGWNGPYLRGINLLKGVAWINDEPAAPAAFQHAVVLPVWRAPVTSTSRFLSGSGKREDSRLITCIFSLMIVRFTL
jgi:hypothetical protein